MLYVTKKRENVTKDILLLEGTFTFDINLAKIPFLKGLYSIFLENY